MKAALQQSRTARAPAEFKIVRLRECPVASPIMNNPEAIVSFWRQHVATAPWFNADKECLVVFMLNTRRRLVGFELLSQGTKDTCPGNTAEVFRLAAMHNAAAILIAHNHPSGDAEPSDADIKFTRELIRAG
jgi:DNA repair protein RadC